MTGLGRAFAEAVAAKDRSAVAGLLTADVDFKALTPRKFWEGAGPDAVLATLFDHWFGEADLIEAVLGISEGDAVEDTGQVSYRFALVTPEGPHTVEQVAYFRGNGDRIGYLRVMCSGFRPAQT